MILRVLKQQYELVRSVDLVRAGRGAIQAAGITLLQRLVSINDGSILTGMRFLAGGFKPSATGADANVTLRPGIAVFYDASEADDWIGRIQWAAIEQPQVLAMSTNNHASGDDRIDSIAMRFVDVDEDPVATKVKDPISGNIEDRTLNTRSRRDVEFKIFEGSAAASPVAATVDSGWFKICEVERPNAVVNVAADGVTDRRAAGETLLGHLRVEGIFSTEGGLIFGEHDDDGLILEPDNPDAPTTLQMRQMGAGGVVTLLAPIVRASTALLADELRAITADVIEIRNSDDDGRAPVNASNLPFSMGGFSFPDPGGALADGAAATIRSSYNVSSIRFRDGGAGSDYVEITFSTAIPDAYNAVMMVSRNQRADAGGPDPAATSGALGYVVAGGATARLYFESGGVAFDQHYSFVVYGA